MNTPTPPTPLAALFALLLGVVLLAFATFLAARRGAGAASFGWALVGGLAFALLGMAAALRAPESPGLAAALAQLLSVALAAGLGRLCAPAAGEAISAGGRLGAVGRMLAWLSLIGLPPTPGFHARILLCRSLLTAGWPGAMALALLASWVLLLPALREARTLRAGSEAGARSFAVGLLIVLLIVMSFSPYAWLALGATQPHLGDGGGW